jgi:23S rRNA (uridine2552-2'-O)-methyltransferase
MKLREAQTDPFRRLAQRAGFKSRAAFKLLEMNRRFRLFSRGSRVIDLGSSPGSWLQVAAAHVGPSGLVVGVDLRPVQVEGENIRFIQSDIRSPELLEALRSAVGSRVDIVLLDAAPKFSGIGDVDVERQIELISGALRIARHLLRRGGKAVIKALEGEGTREVERALREGFERVVRYRPAAVRRHSREFYFVCLGFRGLEASS